MFIDCSVGHVRHLASLSIQAEPREDTYKLAPGSSKEIWKYRSLLKKHFISPSTLEEYFLVSIFLDQQDLTVML